MVIFWEHDHKHDYLAVCLRQKSYVIFKMLYMERCHLANKHGESNMKKNQNKIFIENFNMKGTYLCMERFKGRNA